MRPECRILFVWLLLALFVALGPAYAPVAQADAQHAEYVPGELVLQLVNGADLAAVAAEYALEPTPLDQFGTRPIFRLRILDGTDPQQKAAQLKPAADAGDPRVAFAEPNFVAQTPEGRRGGSAWAIGGDAGTFAAQWAPASIRLAEAHTVSKGAGTIVAVLDTGIDGAHPAFAGRLVAGFDFVDFDADPREEGSYGSDRGFGHGTHVAGLVALTAPEARIMPVRVLDKAGVGNIWVLAEGLLFAVDPDGNPATDDGADVINLSLGTLRETDLLQKIIAEITCDGDGDDDDDDNDEGCSVPKGAVVVAAAGNGGDTTPQYPAAEAVSGSIAVAASTAANTLADFSTRGPWVRLSAPGDQIVSTVPGGAYATWSGTSMAAPVVAGTAALLRARDRGMSAAGVADELAAKSRALCEDGPPQLDAAFALGLPEMTMTDCTRAYLPLVRKGR